jgi:hypothetical protein
MQSVLYLCLSYFVDKRQIKYSIYFKSFQFFSRRVQEEFIDNYQDVIYDKDDKEFFHRDGVSKEKFPFYLKKKELRYKV